MIVIEVLKAGTLFFLAVFLPTITVYTIIKRLYMTILQINLKRKIKK
jgi:hypothetical protein